VASFDHIHIGGLYPLRLGELNVVVAVRPPADPSMAHYDAGELSQEYRKQAGALLDYADRLDRLTAEGWSVTRVAGDLALHEVAGLDQALELARNTRLFDRDYPIEVHTAAAGENELVPAGGLLAGLDPPAGAFPPAMLPALVVCEPSGRQQIVQTAEALHETIAAEVRELRRNWATRPLDLHERGAESLVDELDRLAAGIDERRFAIPLEISLRPGGRLPLPIEPYDPVNRIAVHSVSAVIWEGVTERCAHVPASTRLAPQEGLAGQLRRRGRDVAANLLDGD
jgi:hypothetical protein